MDKKEIELSHYLGIIKGFILAHNGDKDVLNAYIEVAHATAEELIKGEGL